MCTSREETTAGRKILNAPNSSRGVELNYRRCPRPPVHFEIGSCRTIHASHVTDGASRRPTSCPRRSGIHRILCNGGRVLSFRTADLEALCELLLDLRNRRARTIPRRANGMFGGQVDGFRPFGRMGLTGPNSRLTFQGAGFSEVPGGVPVLISGSLTTLATSAPMARQQSENMIASQVSACSRCSSR